MQNSEKPLEWFIVKEKGRGKAIGAVGYIGNKLAVVTSFFEDKDLNKDGKVQLYERLIPFAGGEGSALLAVYTGIKSMPDLYVRDPNGARQGWGKYFVATGNAMIAEGVYMAYFQRSIGSLAGAAAAGIGGSKIKQFVIRKGFEQAVKKAYQSAF